MTRTSEGSDDPDKSAQGRPLGLMTAWLLNCIENDFGVVCRDKEDHCSLFFVYSLNHEIRKKARKHLLSLPNGIELSRYERPRRLAQLEPEEPVEIP